MIPVKKGVDPALLPLVKTAAAPPGPKGGAPVAPAATMPTPSHPAAAAAAMKDPVRTARESSPSSPTSKAASSRSHNPSKAESPSAGSAKAAARREAHVGHATVAPADRERGGSGSGGYHRQGASDIQDWMPFSAQHSRILRTPRAIPAAGSAKVMAHFAHPIRTAVLSMASRFYSEILPSMFRLSSRDAERNEREIRKETLRKDLRQKEERNEARRETIRMRAEADPRRVLAGDLTSAFSTK